MTDIDRFLDEDLGQKGDITSDALFQDEPGKAVIVAKEDCVIAGLEEVRMVFQKTGAETRLLIQDGSRVMKGVNVAEINGPVRSILTGERVALNILGRMSGIASETRSLVELCKNMNAQVTIAATRKTTPGFRAFEKKAVVLGGGEPHRWGLYDAILIKDNHIKSVGSVAEALHRVKTKLPNMCVEIEVESEHDALVAAREGADCIMLDNMNPTSGESVAKKIRKINPKICVEVSGGITRENILLYASFADRISLGYITHSVSSKDFSLELLECGNI